MGAEKSQELIQQARWFEDQVTNLYSRNLFLRQDEKQALLESACMIDKFAARQFVIVTRSESAEHQLDPVLLQNLIVNLRNRQSGRTSDASRLVEFREQAIAFRKKQMSRGKFSQWLDGIIGSSLKLRLENLERETLKLDIFRVEMRQRVALRLLALSVCNAFVREHKTHTDPNVENVIKLFLLRAALKRKRKFYQKLLTEFRPEKSLDNSQR